MKRDKNTGEIKPEHWLEKLIGREGRDRFYLIKTKYLEDKFGEKSILEYIVDNGARMMKQREELLDLIAEKIERVKVKGSKKDEKDIEEKIIENLKIGLPSSVGLTECIKMTEEKFQWSKGKYVGMTVLSVVTNFLGLAFWFFDLYTDSKFVDEMFANSWTNFTTRKENCTTEFLYGKFNQFCSEGNVSTCLEYTKNLTLKEKECKELGPRFKDDDLYMFTEVAVYALVHCISPFFFIFLAGLAQSRTSESRSKKSESKCWKTFKRLFGVLPPVTRIVKIHKERQMFQRRSLKFFKKEIPKMEADIGIYEDSVNISNSVEAATEASPQFFFQTVYLLPSLIINLMNLEVGSWLAVVDSFKGLVSFKLVSIVFSFTAVARSNYSIR